MGKLGQRQVADPGSGDCLDALIAEYESLRDEMIARIQLQQSAFQGTLALSGGLIFLLLSRDAVGLNAEVVLDLLQGMGTPEELKTLAVLLAGYCAGLQLIVAYSVYQLFFIFRISRYLKNFPVRAKWLLGVDGLFQWERATPGLADGNDALQPLSAGTKLAVRVSTIFQMLGAYSLMLASLVVAGHLVLRIAMAGLVTGLAIFVLGAVILALAAGTVLLVLIQVGLHRWLSGSAELTGGMR